jgi:hypothetical protein
MSIETKSIEHGLVLDETAPHVMVLESQHLDVDLKRVRHSTGRREPNGE